MRKIIIFLFLTLMGLSLYSKDKFPILIGYTYHQIRNIYKSQIEYREIESTDSTLKYIDCKKDVLIIYTFTKIDYVRTCIKTTLILNDKNSNDLIKDFEEIYKDKWLYVSENYAKSLIVTTEKWYDRMKFDYELLK